MEFYHVNHNVLDIEKTIAFYQDYFGLKIVKEFDEPDQRLVFLGDGKNSFLMELTYLKGRKEPYDVGETPFHLAFYSDTYKSDYERHKAEGLIVDEVKAMRLHFIKDPDGYLLEILDSDRSNLG